tara:strand:- start:3065 stop:3262 length:198 start_codon:yes stop_codon:yes gene_type:complete
VDRYFLSFQILPEKGFLIALVLFNLEVQSLSLKTDEGCSLSMNSNVFLFFFDRYQLVGIEHDRDQ